MWPRLRRRGERRIQDASKPSHQDPSMWPRLRRRGEPVWPRLWGERARAFNVATAETPWRTESGDAAKVVSVRTFNVATAETPWRTWSWTARRCHCCTFNVATAETPWRTLTVRRQPPTVATLQCGHG